LPFGSGAADAFRDRRALTLRHARDAPATASDPTIIQIESERGTLAPDVTMQIRNFADKG
jgi:hypothetical protein